MRFKDITGKKFGKLTALYRLHNYHKKGTYWICVCDCGNFIETSYDSLHNNAKSCGCLRKETTSKRFKTHGKRNTRLYNIYKGMKARCYNKNNHKYKNYGGRGITVCKEWLNDFTTFYDWSMSHGYDDTLTIDRIDVNGNYEPDNCRWITNDEQQRNKTTNRLITIDNETHCLKEWCDILGLRYGTVVQRLNVYKWTIGEALGLEVKP